VITAKRSRQSARPSSIEPLLAFLVSEDWYFLSHRLRLAEAAIARGYRVVLLTRVGRDVEPIRRAGIEIVAFDQSRSGMNPLAELCTLLRLNWAYRRLRPDAVFHVALKPVLLGSAAARLGVRRAVRFNTLGGLGFAFGGDHRGLRPLRWLIGRALRLLLRGDDVIVQNGLDRALLVDTAGLAPARVHLIPGAGVDLAYFRPRPEPTNGPITAVLVARMLWDKGIGELVDAARILRRRGLALRVRLVGRIDPANPRHIEPAQLEAWSAVGLAEWIGHQDDIAAVWADSHIAVLPSYYREGLPKALMEAAACGRPIVTTNQPGCRDAIIPGETGLLVPPRDPATLADTIERLALDRPLRLRLGRAARADAEARFSDLQINGAILDLIDRRLGTPVPRGYQYR
jgi:glycosyltransferase involved in cell wall biosynthesis